LLIIDIPTIGDNRNGYRQLFSIWRQVTEHPADVLFRFRRCRVLHQNGVAFIGGLAKEVERNRRNVFFDWESMNPVLSGFVQRNGFGPAFGFPGVAGTCIPFRQHASTDPNGVIKYLQEQWLGHGWVSLSAALREAIVARVWELYTNAFEHSESSIGTFSCGEYYEHRRLLKLTIVDFGVGIPEKVRAFARLKGIPADVALRWAFTRGKTTKKEGTVGGLGLDLVKEFIRLNRGALQIFSGDGRAVVTGTSETYYVEEEHFFGTLVNITFRCDDRHYFFASEKPSDAALF
jgi:anti-sigma regulatory factor (Ser/Thr protein kinase)